MREVEGDVFEVVFAGAADVDVVGGLGHVRRYGLLQRVGHGEMGGLGRHLFAWEALV